MKTLFLLGAATLALSGCTSGSTCDTASESCDKTGSDDVVLQSWYGECAGSTCSWEVTATGSIGVVTLSLAETGDTSGSCQTDPNCSPEGFWTEYHDDFTLVDFDDTTETKSISLRIVDSYADQIMNETTIFDLLRGSVATQTTAMMTVTDGNGDYADCITFGDDPSYFSSECTNNGNR